MKKLKIIKIVKTQKQENINKNIFKLKSINKPLKLLKHKNGKILIKVFLKMKKLKIIKIVKTQKRENINKSIFENEKIKNQQNKNINKNINKSIFENRKNKNQQKH